MQDAGLSQPRAALVRCPSPSTASRRHDLPRDSACGGAPVHRGGALGVQLLAARRGREDLLHDPSDHYNCAIGSYTHNIPLPPERAQELDQTLTFMTGLGYVRTEEIPAIPRLPHTPQVVIYAPLGDSPLDPDVVLFAGLPGRLMLLQEAAVRAGIGAQVLSLARPTCMAVPAALASGVIASTG